jgi:hypothetical protein
MLRLAARIFCMLHYHYLNKKEDFLGLVGPGVWDEHGPFSGSAFRLLLSLAEHGPLLGLLIGLYLYSGCLWVQREVYVC